MSIVHTVSDDEKIVRILHRDWIVDGVLQLNAFTLKLNETYISVNRPVIETFTDDVLDFITKHSEYCISDSSTSINLATLITGEVRNLQIELGGQIANVSVEVEPRDKNYQSHAGIFTRFDGKNLKGGQLSEIQVGENVHMPVLAILQKVQHRLVQMSSLEICELTHSSKGISQEAYPGATSRNTSGY